MPDRRCCGTLPAGGRTRVGFRSSSLGPCTHTSDISSPLGVHRYASRCVIRLVWPVLVGAAPAEASCRLAHRCGAALRVSDRCQGGSLREASSWPGECEQTAVRLPGRWSEARDGPVPEEADPMRMNQPSERPPAGVTTSTQAARTRRAVPDASRSGVACQARQTLTASTSP